MSSITLNTQNELCGKEVYSSSRVKINKNEFSELPTELQYLILELIGGVGTQISILDGFPDLQNIVMRRKIMKAYDFFLSEVEGFPSKIAFNETVKKINSDKNISSITFKKITNLALENLLKMLDESEREIVENNFGLYSLSLEKIKSVQQMLLDQSLLKMWRDVKEKIKELPQLPQHPLWLITPELPNDNKIKTIRKWLVENNATLQRINQLILWEIKIIPPELSYFKRLTSLTIWSTELKDISILKNLENLVKLRVWNSQINDITLLSHLTNLQELALGHNQISDITPLANLTNLQDLELINNQISDITPIATLINLEELGLGHNQISDITPIANLTNLQRLNLGNNQIRNISPVAKLINLQSLKLERNQIRDITSIANLENLQELVLRNNPIIRY